jgi:hypothetical protein
MATYDGFVLDDDETDVDGLHLDDGAPVGADVGAYEITASGASSPHYAISYVSGTHHVTPAPLTITADDQTRKYGGAAPTYTASFDGLVNEDTEDDVTGLTLTGPAGGSGVGSYPITPSGATNPNYDIDPVAGTLTITPAPLTIRPSDVAMASHGAIPTYAWHGDGWVNGDSDATFSRPGRTAPTCSAVLRPPGEYAGAITCSGAREPDYAIEYATADLRVDPTISLAQRGLPARRARKAFVDGASVSLPVTARVLRYDSVHSYRFTPVIRVRHRTFVTTTEAFEGPVRTDIDVTATYRTMKQLLHQAEKAGGIDYAESTRIGRRWDTVERLIAPRRKAKLLAALHRFASLVRRDKGEAIRADVAGDLLAHARLVYQRYGGTGTV